MIRNLTSSCFDRWLLKCLRICSILGRLPPDSCFWHASSHCCDRLLSGSAFIFACSRVLSSFRVSPCSLMCWRARSVLCCPCDHWVYSAGGRSSSLNSHFSFETSIVLRTCYMTACDKVYYRQGLVLETCLLSTGVCS